MSPAVLTTVGLSGLFMSVAIDVFIVVGKDRYGSLAIASTMGLVVFSLMLLVAAFESRDQNASVFSMETFDNRTLNLTAGLEVALAVLIARGGALTSLLGATPLTGRQWLIAAIPAVLLLGGWEIGKALARSRSRRAADMERAGLVPTAVPA